jgi:hypothetical protein
MIKKLIWTDIRKAEGFTFVHQNGAAAKYTNWGKRDPKEREFGDCVVAWRGAMYRHNCEKNAIVLCEQRLMFCSYEMAKNQNSVYFSSSTQLAIDKGG